MNRNNDPQDDNNRHSYSVVCPFCKQQLPPSDDIDYMANVLRLSGVRVPCPICGRRFIYDFASGEAFPEP